MLAIKDLSLKKKIIYFVTIAVMILASAGMIYYYLSLTSAPTSSKNKSRPASQTVTPPINVINSQTKSGTSSPKVIPISSSGEYNTELFADSAFRSLNDNMKYSLPQTKVGNKNILK